jgi:hypothetical protein
MLPQLVNLEMLVQLLQDRLIWMKWVWDLSVFKGTTEFQPEILLTQITAQVVVQLVALQQQRHILLLAHLVQTQVVQSTTQLIVAVYFR